MSGLPSVRCPCCLSSGMLTPLTRRRPMSEFLAHESSIATMLELGSMPVGSLGVSLPTRVSPEQADYHLPQPTLRMPQVKRYSHIGRPCGDHVETMWKPC